MTTTEISNWETVCDARDIGEFLGVRALVDDHQIAIFRVKGQFYAIDAIDPFTNAAVLARGIVGDLKGQLVVASPIYKQHFNLETGQCLEDASVQLSTYPVRENNGKIQLAV